MATDRSMTRISGITFYGNRITKARILRTFLEIDSGDAYDSAVVSMAKSRLLYTGIFSRVEIFSVHDTDGVRLQVVLVENPRIMLSDIGGDFCLRYGKVAEKFWQRAKARLGLSLINFRGVMERLNIALTLIEWRGLSLGWHKPFLGTPWYIQIGASGYDYPSLTVPIRLQGAALSISGGRRFGETTTVFASLTSSVKNTQFVDRRNSWILYYRDENDDVDSSRQMHDAFTYPHESAGFFEEIAATGFSIDKRNNRFDPRKGFYFYLQGKTSLLFPHSEVYRDNKYYRDSAAYSAEELEILFQNRRTFDPAQRKQLLARRFLQLDALVHWYHRGFWRSDFFAYRARLIVRDREGGLLNRVSAGGESILRGFASGAVSNNDRANNLFAASMEYRFTMWQTPSFDMMPGIDLTMLGYDLRGFFYRFDAALFLDGALVWDQWDMPLRPYEGHQKALSAGPALRVALPTVMHTIAFDMATICYDQSRSDLWWAWPWERWNLYLDLYF